MKLIALIARYFWDFCLANVTIARQVLSPRMDIEPATIELPTDVRSPLEVLALSNMITFTPGTLTLGIEPGEKLVIHVLDDAEGSARAVRERLEKPLLEITRRGSRNAADDSGEAPGPHT